MAELHPIAGLANQRGRVARTALAMVLLYLGGVLAPLAHVWLEGAVPSCCSAADRDTMLRAAGERCPCGGTHDHHPIHDPARCGLCLTVAAGGSDALAPCFSNLGLLLPPEAFARPPRPERVESRAWHRLHPARAPPFS